MQVIIHHNEESIIICHFLIFLLADNIRLFYIINAYILISNNFYLVIKLLNQISHEIYRLNNLM